MNQQIYIKIVDKVSHKPKKNKRKNNFMENESREANNMNRSINKSRELVNRSRDSLNNSRLSRKSTNNNSKQKIDQKLKDQLNILENKFSKESSPSTGKKSHRGRHNIQKEDENINNTRNEDQKSVVMHQHQNIMNKNDLAKQINRRFKNNQVL